MATDAVVLTTGGTRAERKARAAENDLRSVEYALGRAESALKHAQKQRDLYAGQVAQAEQRLAAARAAVKEEAAGAGPAKKVAKRSVSKK